MSAVRLAFERCVQPVAVVWHWLRRLSGDDAYDVYAAHAHRHGQVPLPARDFWLDALRRRYDRVSRCC